MERGASGEWSGESGGERAGRAAAGQRARRRARRHAGRCAGRCAGQRAAVAAAAAVPIAAPVFSKGLHTNIDPTLQQQEKPAAAGTFSSIQASQLRTASRRDEPIGSQQRRLEPEQGPLHADGAEPVIPLSGVLPKEHHVEIEKSAPGFVGEPAGQTLTCGQCLGTWKKGHTYGPGCRLDGKRPARPAPDDASGEGAREGDLAQTADYDVRKLLTEFRTTSRSSRRTPRTFCGSSCGTSWRR